MPVVVDADALNAFARTRDVLSRLARDTILTPHDREAERLGRAAVGGARLEWARAHAKAWRAVVVLKGATTVVASPSGDAFVHDRAEPALATAGSGDVLAGCIAALCASGETPYRAACAAVLLHGEAGALVAAQVGRRGSLATDVATRLPAALRALTA